MLVVFFWLMALSHSDGGFAQPYLISFKKAETQEPISPTTGESMRTLLSASCGEMSTWMNFWPPQSLCPLPPQVLPLPCDSSQLRRAPSSITTAASGSTYERVGDAHCPCVSGSSPFAIGIC